PCLFEESRFPGGIEDPRPGGRRGSGSADTDGKRSLCGQAPEGASERRIGTSNVRSSLTVGGIGAGTTATGSGPTVSVSAGAGAQATPAERRDARHPAKS